MTPTPGLITIKADNKSVGRVVAMVKKILPLDLAPVASLLQDVHVRVDMATPDGPETVDLTIGDPGVAANHG